MRGRLLGVAGRAAGTLPEPSHQLPGCALRLTGGQALLDGPLLLVVDTRDPVDLPDLLAEWRAEPEAWPPPLPGPFALALWDAERRWLVLARDAVGARPLAWTDVAGGVAFASWPADLVAAGYASGRLALPAVLDTLVLGAPVPPETVYEGVRMVPAGGVVRLGAGWIAEAAAPLAPPARGRASALREAVRAEVAAVPDPASVLLSGGLDSGWLAALALPERRLPAVTVTFAPVSPQVDYATPLALKLGLPHRRVPLGPRVTETWRRLVVETGIPQADLGAGAVAEAVAEAAEAGATAVLSGLGADELFGEGRPARLPGWWARRRVELHFTAEDGEALYGAAPGSWLAWRWLLALRRELLAPELSHEHAVPPRVPPRAPFAPGALATLPEAEAQARLALATGVAARLLPGLEAAAAWRGVEVWTPYLAPAVTALARPGRVGESKPLLRRAAARELGDDVARQRKARPWRPDAAWLLGDPLPEFVADALSPRELQRRGWFDPVTVHHWLTLVRRRPRDPLNRLRARLLVGVVSVRLLEGPDS